MFALHSMFNIPHSTNRYSKGTGRNNTYRKNRKDICIHSQENEGNDSLKLRILIMKVSP